MLTTSRRGGACEFVPSGAGLMFATGHKVANLAEVRAFPQVFPRGIETDRIDRIASHFGPKPKSASRTGCARFSPSNGMKAHRNFVVE